MRQYFYAYHGPSNGVDFDPSGGYGVAEKSKLNKTQVGDLVYVIQKNRKRDFYELCGLYEITGHYHDEYSKRPHRMQLVDTRAHPQRIAIDEQIVSHKLPKIAGDGRLSNFQRHFCRQGASFQSPLKPAIVAVLDEILAESIDADKVKRVELEDVESDFKEAVKKSSQSSSDERIRRLKESDKFPKSIAVSTNAYLRNPDVVAETLFQSKGVCGNCKNKAPFTRLSDGSPYLEVHHKIPLAQGGEDTLENAIALCPNCHREMHFGM